jgi:integrase/recombinase XerD
MSEKHTAAAAAKKVKRPARHRKHGLHRHRGEGREAKARPDHPFMGHVERYIEWRRVTGASERTLGSLEAVLTMFVDWCAVRSIRDARELTRAVLETYQRYLFLMRKADGQALTIGTQLTRLRALRGWCAWLSRERVIEHNAAADLVLPRASKTLPKVVPSVEQIARLMAQPDLSEVTGARDRAILEVLYSTGMRAFELCGLSLSDVDLERCTVWIRQGKGRKDRFIPLGKHAGEWLARYLSEVRPLLVVSLEQWSVFLTDYGEGYRVHQLGQLVTRYLRLADIEHGGCHALRHACATHMLENGADTRFIQALLGHASLESTQIYTRVAIGKLAAIHAATHPAERGE